MRWLRQRWVRWSGLFVLVGGLIVVLMELATTKPHYKFLAGQAGVRTPDNRAAETSVHELVGEFDEWNRRASAELIPAGYARTLEAVDATDRLVAYRSSDQLHLIHLSWSNRKPNQVAVWVRHEGPKPSSAWSWIRNPFTTRCCGFSPMSACILNLKQFEGAKANWAIESSKGTNDVPRDSDLFGLNAYIRVKPQCPSGGRYWLGRVDEIPRCSIPGHAIE